MNTLSCILLIAHPATYKILVIAIAVIVALRAFGRPLYDRHLRKKYYPGYTVPPPTTGGTKRTWW
jgi:hypothetical protein